MATSNRPACSANHGTRSASNGPELLIQCSWRWRGTGHEPQGTRALSSPKDRSSRGAVTDNRCTVTPSRSAVPAA